MKHKVKCIDWKNINQKKLSVKVAMWLFQKGFSPADQDGVEIDPLRAITNKLGILYDGPNHEYAKCLFGLITPKRRFSGTDIQRHIYPSFLFPRRQFLGFLSMTNSQNWTFELYGRKYVDIIKQLSSQLSSDFDVNITIHLLREEAEKEWRSDGLYLY